MMLTDEEVYTLKWAQKSEKYTSRRYVEETDTKAGYYEDVEVCADSTVAFARAVIAENNKKVLADLKPVGFLDKFNCFYTFRHPEMRTREMFSADQVAALIQERDALAAKVKELEAQAEMDSAQINSLIKKLPPLPGLQPRKARFA